MFHNEFDVAILDRDDDFLPEAHFGACAVHLVRSFYTPHIQTNKNLSFDGPRDSNDCACNFEGANQNQWWLCLEELTIARIQEFT